MKLCVAPVWTLPVDGDRLTETDPVGVGELAPLEETPTPAHPDRSEKARKSTEIGTSASLVGRSKEIAMAGVLLRFPLGDHRITNGFRGLEAVFCVNHNS